MAQEVVPCEVLVGGIKSEAVPVIPEEDMFKLSQLPIGAELMKE